MPRGVQKGAIRGPYYGAWARDIALDIARQATANPLSAARRFKSQATAVVGITKENVKASTLYKSLKAEIKAAQYSADYLKTNIRAFSKVRVQALFEFSDREIDNIVAAEHRFIEQYSPDTFDDPTFLAMIELWNSKTQEWDDFRRSIAEKYVANVSDYQTITFENLKLEDATAAMAMFRQFFKLNFDDVATHSEKYELVDSLVKESTGWDEWFS